MTEVLEKVTAFVLRPSAIGHDLLLFEHPSAGIQIPAGTVEIGEAPRDAVLRETREETGLTTVAIRQDLGCVETRLPDDQRAIRITTAVYARPTVASFDGARLPRGLRVHQERRHAGFAQITYQEWDRLEEPRSISYRVTGWVPAQTLASVERRHFFLLACSDATPERWTVIDEIHRFTLFWAPLTELPGIVRPQAAWLAMLPDELWARP